MEKLTEEEINKYTKNLTNLDISLIGSVQWFDQCEKVDALHKQSYLEITGAAAVLIPGILIQHEKVPELIYMVVSAQIWRQSVLPKLMETDLDYTSRLNCYSILFQEGPVITLLRDLLHHKQVVQCLDDHALDLIDYCASSTVSLVSMKVQEEPLNVEDLKGNIQKMEFTVGLNCLAILASFGEYIDELNVSAVVRMFSTHDVPLLVAQVIESHPWKRRSKKGWQVFGQNNKWAPLTSDELSKYEAQCWICLRGLLLHPLASQHYELTSNRCSALQKLQKHLTESVIDQMSPLIELKQLLGRLGLATPANVCRPPLIVETVAPITSLLLSQQEKWGKLTEEQKQMIMDKQHFTDIVPYIMKIFSGFEEADQPTPSDDGQILCMGCGAGGSTLKKCSKCKDAYYCSRQCQVKDWPNHKSNC